MSRSEYKDRWTAPMVNEPTTNAEAKKEDEKPLFPESPKPKPHGDPFKFNAPPVPTVRWSEEDWMRYFSDRC